MLMVQNMMDIGRMISRKVMELRHGLMEANMKDFIEKVRRMGNHYNKKSIKVRENIIGLMGVFMLDSGKIIKFMGLGNIIGLMEEKYIEIYLFL